MLQLIIRREFLAKVRNKSFIILTFLSPFLIVGMAVSVYFLTKVNESTVKEILIVNESSFSFEEDFKNTEYTHYSNVTPIGLEESNRQVQKNKYYGLLYIPNKSANLEKLSGAIAFYSEDTPSLLFVESLEKKIENRLKHYKFKELGISQEKIASAAFDIAIQQSNFEGQSSSKLGNGLRIGMGMGAGYLVMMFIIIYGNSVMRSVIEEKTNRIIEIIISSVKPFQLMLGKIIGNASAGLLQFFIWGILVFTFITIGVVFLDVDLQATSLSNGALNSVQTPENQDIKLILTELQNLPIFQMFVFFVFYFLGGFFLYSSLYAAIGAAVDSETDTQQFVLPVMLPLMLAVYVGFASVISDPHGSVATIFSIVPFTSSIVMLMRIPFGVPMWQLILSLALLLLSFLFMVWFAAKIYRVGILMYGKKPSYKDLYRWLKY